MQLASWEVKSAGASIPSLLGAWGLRASSFLVNALRAPCLVDHCVSSAVYQRLHSSTCHLKKSSAFQETLQETVPKHTHTHIHTQIKVHLKPTGLSVNLMETPCDCSQLHWVLERGQKREHLHFNRHRV